MHMWDETPARRFVILDGQRMAEATAAVGLSVVEIRRDGGGGGTRRAARTGAAALSRKAQSPM